MNFTGSQYMLFRGQDSNRDARECRLGVVSMYITFKRI
jgi:hypothetical protein